MIQGTFKELFKAPPRSISTSYHLKRLYALEKQNIFQLDLIKQFVILMKQIFIIDMITLLSPSKSLDYSTQPNTTNYTLPRFLKESSILIDHLKKLSSIEISKLMDVS